MVIVLRHDISDEDKKRIKSFLCGKDFKINEVDGEEQSIIAAVGRLVIAPEDVSLLPGVEKVIPISKPYKLASREFKPENTVVELNSNRGQKIRIGGQRIVAVAGPSMVESPERMFSIAESVQQSGACILKGGTFKPRTSPYAFQGLAEEGVKILKSAGEKFGLPVVSEIMSAGQIKIMKKHGVDCLLIGSVNMQNYDLLKSAGKSRLPVILERGKCASLEELLMSAEYLLSEGSSDVILCERGIRTYEKDTRNTLDLSAVPVLRGMTHLPIIVDPANAVGICDKIAPMALAAVASGADGISVEVHDNPEKAFSDGQQALLPSMFDKLMHDIEAFSPVIEKSVVHIRGNDGSENYLSSGKNKTLKKERLVCAYNGIRGTYAEQAVERYFDGATDAMPLPSFREVFKAVVNGQADYGMIPIENSLGGSVYDNYDNLVSFEDVSIVGALHLRIQHALLARKGTEIDSIKRVYSHPQGFAQCSKLIESRKWEKITASSTANAAKMVSESGTNDCAAIASSITAKYYNLEILCEDIQDDPRDYTRFVVIAANHIDRKIKANGKVPNVASFVFCTPNETGALYKVLGIFQKHDLNLTRLESRPIVGQPWHYWFYADVEIKEEILQNEESVQDFMAELKKSAEEVRLLGVYSEAGNSI